MTLLNFCRVVNPNGMIHTLVGREAVGMGPPRPSACHQRTLPVAAGLQWPTSLAINPLDQTLHVVDDTVVVRLTPDLRLQVVAGKSPLCNDPGSLGSVSDLDFSSNGDMVFSTKNGLYKMNAGNEELDQVEFNGDAQPTQSISSLAVLPNGEVTFNNPDRLKVTAAYYYTQAFLLLTT